MIIQAVCRQEGFLWVGVCVWGGGGGCSQGKRRGGWAGLLEQFSESVLIEDRPNGMTGGPGELALLGGPFFPTP